MAHAEKCPICDGKGRIKDLGAENWRTKMCHGCNGKGWVEIADCSIPVWSRLMPEPKRLDKWVESHYPYGPWPIVTYTYER